MSANVVHYASYDLRTCYECSLHLRFGRHRKTPFRDRLAHRSDQSIRAESKNVGDQVLRSHARKKKLSQDTMMPLQ